MCTFQIFLIKVLECTGSAHAAVQSDPKWQVLIAVAYLFQIQTRISPISFVLFCLHNEWKNQSGERAAPLDDL